MNVAVTTTAETKVSAPNASRLLLSDLPRDLGVRVRELHTKISVWNLVCVLYPLAWFATAATVQWLTAGRIAIPHWVIRVAGLVIIGIFIQAIAILMHEALHGNLFQSTRLNRWAMFAFGVPAFFSGTAYKMAHLNHHRQTRTEQDQDEISNLYKTPAQYRAIFYALFFVATFIYLFVVLPRAAIQMSTYRQRCAIALEYAALVMIYSGVIIWGVSTGHTDWLLWYWILPMLVAMFLSNIRGLSEHLCTSTDHVLGKTRTIRSNRLVSFLMLNLNYHLEHHLFPGVPWYNLRKVHRELQPVYIAARPFVERSYIRYALKALFRGPFHEIRDSQQPRSTSNGVDRLLGMRLKRPQ
jgi:fatty acid desaturase